MCVRPAEFPCSAEARTPVPLFAQGSDRERCRNQGGAGCAIGRRVHHLQTRCAVPCACALLSFFVRPRHEPPRVVRARKRSGRCGSRRCGSGNRPARSSPSDPVRCAKRVRPAEFLCWPRREPPCRCSRKEAIGSVAGSRRWRDADRPTRSSPSDPVRCAKRVRPAEFLCSAEARTPVPLFAQEAIGSVAGIKAVAGCGMADAFITFRPGALCQARAPC